MGMGEPLANYKAVIGAVRQLVTPTPDGLGLSARGITVSTVGLVPRMQQLATEGLPVTLALSLHAPDDELRDELVPINTRWNVEEVVERRLGVRAGDQAPGLDRVHPDPGRQRPGLPRRPAGQGAAAPRQLGLGARQPDPDEPDPGIEAGPPRGARTRTSSSAGCEPRGVPVTVRDTRGREIDGACGQLAAHQV